MRKCGNLYLLHFLHLMQCAADNFANCQKCSVQTKELAILLRCTSLDNLVKVKELMNRKVAYWLVLTTEDPALKHILQEP